MMLHRQTRPPVLSRDPTSADMIRSRFFHKLGIYDPHYLNASVYHTVHSDTRKRLNQKEARQIVPQVQAQQQVKTNVPRQISVHHALVTSSPQEHEDTSTTTKHSSPYVVQLNLVREESEDSFNETPSSPNSCSGVGFGFIPEAYDRNFEHSKPRSKPKASVQFNPSVKVTPIESHRDLSPQKHAELYGTKEQLAYNTIRNTREFVYEGWNWRHVLEEDNMYTCRSSGEYIHPVHVGRSRLVNPYL